MAIDEYTLAAFMSGELSGGSRKTVAAALIEDAEARDVLAMAAQALSVAFSRESVRYEFMDRATRPPAKPGRADRVPKQRGVA